MSKPIPNSKKDLDSFFKKEKFSKIFIICGKNSFKSSRIIALTKKSDNSISNLVYKETDILLFGREDTGLPDNIMNSCEIVAGIPMPGGENQLKTCGVRSLNLSVACGIVCYSACLQLNLLNKLLLAIYG